MGGRTKGEGSGFGPVLKRLREAAGISQQELADRAGLNVGGVTKVEQGQREPSWETVLALASALGVTPNEFLPVEAPSPEPAPRPTGKRK